MSIYIAIAFGGALGAMSRYWVATMSQRWLGDSFPYATLTVNIIGAILVGFLSIILTERINVSHDIRLGLIVGFLGAFTTFSAFALDTVYLIESGAILKAVTYSLISLIFSVLGVWSGIFAAKTYF